MNNFETPDKIERTIKEKGVYAGKTEGDSMEPMLSQGRDTVIIKKAEFPLKRYDIPVYRRENQHIMHRIIKVKKNGYIICGDNRIALERDITDSDIVGVLAAFYRKGEYVEYGSRKYMYFARRAVATYPLRLFKSLYIRAVRKLKRIVKKLVGKVK